MENYVQLRQVLTPSGVYLLLYQGEVVYVGKSESIFHRLANHQWNLRRVLNRKDQYTNRKGPVVIFDDVRVRFMPVDQIAAEEVRMIRHYQPKYNTHFRRPKYEISHLPGIQVLFAKARERKELPIIRRKLSPDRRIFIQPPTGYQRRRVSASY